MVTHMGFEPMNVALRGRCVNHFTNEPRVTNFIIIIGIFQLFLVNNINMNNEEYDKLIKEVVIKDKPYKNLFISFVFGGLAGLIGEVLFNIFNNYFNISDSYLLVFIVYIVIGSVLTGIGVFDKILSFCKCGLIVPSTGFANTMTSCAMDTRSEGFVKGIGGSIFKLTGSIILYGVIFGIIFGYLRSII